MYQLVNNLSTQIEVL